MNKNNQSGLTRFAPALYLLLGVALGGGGVYALGLARASGPVHVGETRPAGDLALSRPGTDAVPTPRVGDSPAPLSDGFAAQSVTAVPANPAARSAAAPAPGAAPQAPRPAGDQTRLVASRLGAQGSVASSAYEADGSAPAAAGARTKAAKTATPRLAARTTLASGSIRYGVASRAELMGRGAGPVYNLKGNGPAQADNVNSLIKQVGTMVQGAEAQVDSTQLPDAARQQIKQSLQTAATATQPAQ